MPNVRGVEFALIQQDCAALVEMLRRVTASPDKAGSVAVGIPPFFALVAEESYAYLASPAAGNLRRRVDSALFAQYAGTVKKLRARVKLFDDTKGGLDGLVETLAVAQMKSLDWFQSYHPGPEGELARGLQPDLGVFWIRDLPCVSTHGGLITLGLQKADIERLDLQDIEDQVNAFVYDWSVAAGEYLSCVSGLLGSAGYPVDLCLEGGTDPGVAVTHTDHFGRVVYEHLSQSLGVDEGLEAAAFFVVTQACFVNYVLPALLPEGSFLLRRARFLTAYHSTNALRIFSSTGLAPDSTRISDFASAVVINEDASFLLSSRELRNIFAHYALRQSARFLSNDGIEGVISGVSGRASADIDALVCRQLNLVCNGLESVVSKRAFWPLRNHFGDNT